MLDTENVVYVFRHIERWDYVSVYHHKFDSYKRNPDYVHVGTVDPLVWISHSWKYGGGSVYIYNIKGTSDVIAVTETANWDYENDPDYEFVEEIELYCDWIESHYEYKKKGRNLGEE